MRLIDVLLLPTLGTTKDGWSIALAFYSGLWAYEGWNLANLCTEEVKDVKSTMTKAILGSTVLTTCLYPLANVSYFAVLSSQQVNLCNSNSAGCYVRVVLHSKLF